MKRRLLIIAIFLLLGAVVNVAVAWACAIHGSHDRDFQTRPPNKIYNRVWSRYAASDWPAQPDIWVEHQRRIGRRRLVGSIRTGRRGWRAVLSELQVGWPRACLRGASVTWGDGAALKTELVNSFIGRFPLPWRREREWFLPTSAIWPGFAANTLFYAAILWLLLLGPFAMRRFLRLRWGLCPKCAYPMGESAVCSECGEELPMRPAAT